MRIFRPRPLSLAVSMLCVCASTAFAVDIRNLEAVGGNQTQQSVGVFIDDWLTDNASFANAGGLEQELFELCADYANIVGAATTDAEINDALSLLSFVTNEEVAAIGSGLTDTGHDQTVSVLGRLQSLRAGIPNVASINGLGSSSGGAAGSDFSRLSFYANSSFGDGDKDETVNEQGFDFDSEALTLGVDYRFTDNIIGGVALGFGSSDVEIDNDSGDTESDTVSLTFYGSYYEDGWYVDASLGFAEYDYDSERNLPVATLGLLTAGLLLDQNLQSSTDGDSVSWSIGGGFTQNLKGWNANYSLRLDGVDATVDGYTESGGSLALRVGDQNVESLQAVLGAQFSKAFSQKWGVISPYAGIEIHQEFDDETRVVTAQYLFDSANNQFSFSSDDADDSYFLVSVGASVVLTQGAQLFVNLDHLAGLDDVDSNTFTAGVRFEF